MDSAALLNGIWPLETDELTTSVEGHEQQWIEWHEPPLIGADVIDVSPQRGLGTILLDVDCKGGLQTGQTWTTQPLGELEICGTTLPFIDTTVGNLVPMYEALNQIKEEVAKNIEEEILDGGANFDLNEDIGVDDLQQFLDELDAGSCVPDSLTQISFATNVVEPCQPSPAPSFDSDSGLGSSSSDVSSALDRFTVTVDAGVGFEEPRESEEERLFPTIYSTIDSGELQFVHWEGEEEEVSGRCQEDGVPSAVEETKQFLIESKCNLEAFNDHDASLESAPPAPNEGSRVPVVAQFHSYAQKPEVQKSAKGAKGAKRKRGRAVDEEAIAMKKLKKKEQNKTAAQRYRMNKKMEAGTFNQEEQEEERRNKELKAQVASLEGEIKYLKNLMAEFQNRRDAVVTGCQRI